MVYMESQKQNNAHKRKIVDITAYNREYAKRRRLEKPNLIKKYQGNTNAYKKYNIGQETRELYQNDLYLIIKINEIVKQLNYGTFEKYLRCREDILYERK